MISIWIAIWSWQFNLKHRLYLKAYDLIWDLIRNICDLVWKGLTTTTVLRSFFRDHPGEPVPEENFWTLWCTGRLTEADTPTVRLGATPSGLSSAHLHHPPFFLHAGCPSYRPINSVKALKAKDVNHSQSFLHVWCCCEGKAWLSVRRVEVLLEMQFNAKTAMY